MDRAEKGAVSKRKQTVKVACSSPKGGWKAQGAEPPSGYTRELLGEGVVDAFETCSLMARMDLSLVPGGT